MNTNEFILPIDATQRASAMFLIKEQLIEEMDHNLDALPGIETSFSQPIRDNVLESISQIDGQVVLKVFGGLVSATCLTLMVLPTRYLVIERRVTARFVATA